MTKTATRRDAPALPALTPAQALMSVAVMAASSDGRLKPRELQRLRLLAHEHALFARVESADEFISERAEHLKAFGRESVLSGCRAALSPRLRETAYAWAVRIVQDDASHHQKEHAFLRELGAVFGVPGPLAAKIRAVSAVLRRAG